MTILEKIDKLRRERGWSINNLAMEAMLTQSTLNNLYLRKTEPKLSTLRAICGAFGITLAEFFADDDCTEQEKTDLDNQIKNSLSGLTTAQKKALLELIRTIN